MKYRHSHHAGNFADVHKHVTLLALLTAMQRKPKGLLYVDTHAGRGTYDLEQPGAEAGEASEGVLRLMRAAEDTAGDASSVPSEIADYIEAVRSEQRTRGSRQAYPGSPALMLNRLRDVDRALLIEAQQDEFIALRREFERQPRTRLRHGDGFAALASELPPVERRALVLIDPPYEETREDYRRVEAGLQAALQRFETGVLVVWYPIKLGRDAANWRRAVVDCVKPRSVRFSELWRFPLDSRVGLNGSGLAIVNPPYLFDERMRAWLPWLAGVLDPAHAGGCGVLDS